MAKKTKTAKPPSTTSGPPNEPALAVTSEVDSPFDMQRFDVPISNQAIHGYVTNRCDVQMMTEQQRYNLRRLLHGLVANDATLGNGKFVNCGQDVVKWILEQIGDHLGVMPQ